MFPHGETVVILSTTTTTDDYGNTSTEVVQFFWEPCAVAPRTPNERSALLGPAVIVGLTVYGPPIDVLDIDADDQFVVRGEVYEVDGDAGDWRNPFTGWHPGLEVAIKRASEV